MTHVVILVGYEKVNERIYNTACLLLNRGASLDTLLWDRGYIDEHQRTAEENVKLCCKYLGRGSGKTVSSMMASFIRYHLDAYKIVVRTRPDALHVAHLALLPLAVLLRKRVGTKIIFDGYEFHAFSLAERLSRFLPASFATALSKKIERLLVSRTDGVLTIDSNDSFLINDYRKIQPNSEVLYNVPPKTIECNFELARRLSEQYKGRYVILYVGGITRAKGALDIPYVVQMIKERCPEVLMVLVGRFRDDCRKEFYQLANRLGIEEYVEVIDWLPFKDMCSYLSVSSIGLAIYRDVPRFRMLGSGNGRKLFMYMYYGVPTVVTDLGAIGSLIKSEGAGLTVDTRDRNEIAKAIVSLLTDNDERFRMSMAGRNAIARQYNWETEQSKVLAVYDRAGLGTMSGS